MSKFEGRAQVENELGRALIHEELLAVPSINELSPAHLAVLRGLVRCQRLAALLYLRAVVADSTTPELFELIDRCE